jgi:hypothetical protein
MSEFNDFLAKILDKKYIFQKNELEKYIKIEDNVIIIINYINNAIIPNCMIDYSNYVENDDDISQFKELKELFISEGIQIIKKLNNIILKHIDKKPNEFVNIDIKNNWYLNEPSIIENKNNYSNIFFDYALISKILTINFKLIDFMNDQYLNEIKYYEDRENYLKHILVEKKNELSYFEYLLFKHKVNRVLKSIDNDKKNIIDNFKILHENSKTIHNYFLSLFSYMKNSNLDNYISFLPLCTLNIFRSSLYFIEDSDSIDFLNFIIQFEDWIPSLHRCIYLSKILGLSVKSEFKNYLNKFNPDINLIICDLISMHKKIIKDSSVLNDINLFNSLLSYIFKKKKYIISLDKDQLVHFISTELEILSKIKENSEHISNNNDYLTMIKNCLAPIKYILFENKNICDSYLIYQIPTTLLSLYNTITDDYELKEYLDSIFLSLLENKLGIIYLSSILDDGTIKNLQIPLSEDNKLKLLKWCEIYKKMNNFSDYDQLVDPITSCTIVTPCVIPMDNSGKMLQICDKNMIISYIWNKSENPFTRSSLTIEELEKLNENEESIEKIKEFNKILKSAIDFSKK